MRRHDSNALTVWVDEQLVGVAVMQFFAEYAHPNLTGGMFAVHLEVRAESLGARAFYRALGYRETRYVPGYHNGREAAVCMTHDLRYRRPQGS